MPDAFHISQRLHGFLTELTYLVFIAATHWLFREVLLKKLLTLELLLGQKYHPFASVKQKQLRGWAFSHRWDGLKHHTLTTLPKVLSCWVWASAFRAFPEEGAQICSEHQTLTLESPLVPSSTRWLRRASTNKEVQREFYQPFLSRLGIFWDRSCIRASSFINLKGFFITLCKICIFLSTIKKYFMLLSFMLDTAKSY